MSCIHFSPAHSMKSGESEQFKSNRDHKKKVQAAPTSIQKNTTRNALLCAPRSTSRSSKTETEPHEGSCCSFNNLTTRGTTQSFVFTCRASQGIQHQPKAFIPAHSTNAGKITRDRVLPSSSTQSETTKNGPGCSILVHSHSTMRQTNAST